MLIMNLYAAPPIQAINESYHEHRHRRKEQKKPTDSKVKGFFLDQIGKATAGGRAALLPSATAPRIMFDLLAILEIPTRSETNQVDQQIELMPSSLSTKRHHLRRVFGKHTPVGLRRCEPHGWINSWMQFFLYLPKLPDFLSFTPRRFDVFREFIDHYSIDQQENRSVSLANGASLVRCLLRMLPQNLFKTVFIDFYEIFKAFFKALFPHVRFLFLDPYLRDALIFHPEWHLLWKVDSCSLEEETQKMIQNQPKEILVSIRGQEPLSRCAIKKQLFPRFSRHLCYDLDAFVERRSDGRNSSFITYVKVEGTWYQCDDDRITSLRSTTLSLPLYQSILLHYKKIEFNSGWCPQKKTPV